ncbi:MAG: penicillin acylase family protein [Flavobacteriales bacterium]|nr:penicillin acylase family protein [Flavobacteriales bacterium]
MRFFKRTFLVLTILVILFAVWFNFYAESKVPEYEGTKNMPALSADVSVGFDAVGIPHIVAENKLDAYYSLGYLMASERLFQMEVLRRVGKGELSEILGDKTIGADVFFRSLDLGNHAMSSAQHLIESGNEAAVAECESFLAGINAFIDEGNPPLEFAIGIDMSYFELEDIYAIAGYMAYSFSIAAQTDLLATEMSLQHGENWPNEMGLDSRLMPPFNQSCSQDSLTAFLWPSILEDLGLAEFKGSNAWAVNGFKTKSGKAMMCNDTHIGYNVPQVWYEAAINTEGFNFYGNFIPGIPYALVGHDEVKSWGLTMFENDDIDLYTERLNENGLIQMDSTYYEPEIHDETIAISGQADTTIQVIRTHNGHLINGAIAEMSDYPVVSLRWEYTQGENNLLNAFRSMNNAENLAEFETALEDIHAPGLNVVYADSADNIGWWACARMPKHPAGVDSKKAIPGYRGANQLTEHYSFDRNPHCVNPPSGIVSTANEQPETTDSLYIPGYYVPPVRAARIRQSLLDANNIDVEFMKNLLLDVVNTDDAKVATYLNGILSSEAMWSQLSEFEQQCAGLLSWNGSYDKDAPAPVLYQPLQVRLLHAGLKDEMTDEQFERFRNTHWMRRLLHLSLNDKNHLVWDIQTTDKTETLDDHLLTVYQSLCADLKTAYGDQPLNWKWGEAHTWHPQHMLKDIPMLGNWISAEPVPMSGSNETISQSGFTPSEDVHSVGRFGAQMRIIIDFKDINESISVAPTGQSGVWRSPYYLDQFELYANGEFRPQHLFMPDSLTFQELQFNTAD